VRKLRWDRNRVFGKKPGFLGFCILSLALLVVGCQGKSPTLAGVFPGADAVPGWTPAGAAVTFNRDTIFDLVDGQADAFFVYGFEQVAVHKYQNAQGAGLSVEVWQLATPADAYGLFTSGIAGTPVAIGNDGDGDPGWRIIFWQDRYYVQVYARQELADADLQGLARAVAAALPAGGERPALVSRLPAEGLVERGFIFFHEEISIQSEVWLGGENILGLSPQTNGLLARYDLGGTLARLLLIEYPDTVAASAAQAASAGLAALNDSEVSGLVTANARDNLLGAVFGEVDEGTANTLLTEALGD
jgi:hypothetical protein